MFGKRFINTKAAAGLAVASTALLLAGFTAAQQNSESFPWQAQGYRGYNEAPAAIQLINPSAAPVAPERYQLYANALPMKTPEAAERITLVAHVPEHAKVWLGGGETTSTGTLRTYVTPPLPAGSYTYDVRVDWVEAGKKVTQTQTIPVQPGGMYCVYLVQPGSKMNPGAKVVEANLAKLSPDDQELARSQKYCPIQDSMALGAMGPPTKIMVNGQPVLLCCSACRLAAEKNPEKTLAKVKELKGTPATPRDK
jgi:uncharacterized protein (TIGR03000 family)